MATIEEVNEPIDVVTIFRHGAMAPVKFRWAGRTHQVERVAYRWVSREGAHPIYHFSVVTADDQTCEIELDTRNMRWAIARVQVEG